MADRHETGMEMRRRVLGDDHVDRTEASTTHLDADFQRYITEAAWGAVWARPGLDLRTRHLVTMALLAAQGREGELVMHLRAIGRTGVTPEEVREMLMHVAVYAGVPAANAAFSLTKQILEE